MSLLNLSSQQLRQAADLKEKIAALGIELSQLFGSTVKSAVKSVAKATKKKWTMSAAARAKISAAAKKRWAKVKGKTLSVKPVKKAKRTMSAAAKAKLSKLAKARWAKVKASGKKSL